ncbi:n -(beta-n-acetylglucosaminyl)-l-asparaginase [Nannochloropsis gaditana]|uniref:N-(Beta-n-acetylglucosaminyl)-l-asparaginase n=1 Tax=Nannochloropsis gaditana TaxID=72520 RepID=W7U1H5_9STRA|nr:n -(beta-n-acetylglucosaminyl)-l-asparaginase [Nannochloropsis gaditana]
MNLFAIMGVLVYYPAVSFASALPLVLNTWSEDFTGATRTAFDVISQATGRGGRLDALEQGLNFCELHQCGGSVGFGGHSDASGEVTLDAMVMDGVTHDVGGVGGLRRVKRAVSVARGVLEHTNHSLLVGEAATRFAVDFLGFEEESLSTPESVEEQAAWVAGGCQPNYYRAFDHCTSSCPPYVLQAPGTRESGTGQQMGRWGRVGREEHRPRYSPYVEEGSRQQQQPSNHDTIGMVVVDREGELACGVTTNGLGHKVPGRVGDSPVPGAGCYVERGVGGCACTGDGDVMMRFSPSARAVMGMEAGMAPQEAAEAVVGSIARYYPDFRGGIVCADAGGGVGAAAWKLPLSFSTQSPETEGVQVYSVTPLGRKKGQAGDVARVS